MPCMVCEAFSWSHLCRACYKEYLTPLAQWRTLENGLRVLSFFAYDEIDILLKSKHHYHGYYIYKLLAQASFKNVHTLLKLNDTVTALAIDDYVKEDYAHTALLAQAMRSRYIKPQYAKLHAKNRISYAGKDLAFRLAHPRDFVLKKMPPQKLVLVDDIVTSGTTLSEASSVCKRAGHEVLCAVVLADANR